jgi:hypothetical protein
MLVLMYCYSYGVVLHKASHALRPFMIYCASMSEFESFVIHPPDVFGIYQQGHVVTNQKKLGEKWP